MQRRTMQLVLGGGAARCSDGAMAFHGPSYSLFRECAIKVASVWRAPQFRRGLSQRTDLWIENYGQDAKRNQLPATFINSTNSVWMGGTRMGGTGWGQDGRDRCDVQDVDLECSPIQQFYQGKTVFITGATGFMGKVLLEKLLRSTEVSRVYLLIRPKKGNSSQDRLQALMEDAVFDRLKMENKEFLHKVETVSGDITEESLGLSREENSLLLDSVNIVFHCAATVKFDEELSLSVGMNVAGVMRVVALAKRMAHLQALVDVSTAYCNYNIPEIDEMIYPAPVDSQRMVDLCQWLDPEIINSPEVTKKFIGDRPNTYTFTKALAESFLASSSMGLPEAVMRPSMVTASWKEPHAGWVDNFNGPTGLFASRGLGVIRRISMKREGVADFVPVDVSINMLCCIAWQAARDGPDHPIKVYNCTSGGVNPVTWGEVDAIVHSSIRKTPYSRSVWYPGRTIFKPISPINTVGNWMQRQVFHYGVAHVVDLVCRLVGKKPFLVRQSNIITENMKVVKLFRTNSWNWTNKNTLDLEASLMEVDKQVFGFDMKGLDWKNYFDNYILGIREYVLKDPATQTQARKHLFHLRLLDWLTKGGFGLMIIWVLKP